MKKIIAIVCFIAIYINVAAQNKHSKEALFPSYTGLVMCGYQGWFAAQGDDLNKWGHYGRGSKFDKDNLTIDIWPDVSEYEKTYPTPFKHKDGTVAHVFSSRDKSTVDVHFKWMKEYNIDGVFLQRFYGRTRDAERRERAGKVLDNAFAGSRKHKRAIAVMYDLSGLRPDKDDCTNVIEDWKYLVDEKKVTSNKTQTYLHHNEKPVVAIWGIGFPDRPYNIRDIKIMELIDFLQNDPVYGGCTVMLGVPTYFRDLDSDCISDPFLHEVIKAADIIMPWMVARFTLDIYGMQQRYRDHIKKDIAWCKEAGVEYAPCIYPGFSWYNLSQNNPGHDNNRLEAIPRKKGEFIWTQFSTAIEQGATMLYVAMFDEIDEATAIFKCTNNPPVDAKFIDYEGLPSDFYLKLTGKAGEMLRKEIPFSKDLYKDEKLRK